MKPGSPQLQENIFQNSTLLAICGQAQVTSGYINYWRAPQECTLVLIKICDLSYINAGMFGEGGNSEHVMVVKFHVGPLPLIYFKKVI